MDKEPKANLVDQARRTLERYILEGALRPDQHLVEAELARQLGISRTPLREALRQLEIKGYLSKRNSVGYAVTCRSSQDMREVYDVRLALETLAVKLACDRITQQQLQRAEHFLAEYDRAMANPRIINMTTFYHGEGDWNNLFHLEIYRASGNNVLVSQIESLRDVDRLQHVVRYFRNSDLAEFQKQHYKILGAIKARDKIEAEAAIKKHLDTVYDFYLMFL